MGKFSKPGDSRKKLEDLVKKARTLLGQKREEYDRDDVALLDMTDKAEAALNGKKFPFTCQRQFWDRTEEDEIKFALQHYTMVPSFFGKGKGYSTYGLEEAISWYQNKEEHVSQNSNKVRLNIHEITDGNFFLSNRDMKEIRNKISEDFVFKKQYEEMKKIADEATLEEVENRYRLNFQNADYPYLREQFVLWRQVGNGANFSVPETAIKAKVFISLLPEDNMEDGLGYIWLRNLCLRAADGHIVQIIGKEETIYLENVCRDNYSIWISKEIKVCSGESYTLEFEALQEGKFKKGVRITLVFSDEYNKNVNEYEYFYNKKSWIPIENYNLTMQCDAVVYMVTGDTIYANKAKIEMLHMLDDFCQGAYYWMVYNERPEGLDCYGAVQAGRNLCSLAVTYALIEDAKIFTKEEKTLFYELIDFLLHYVLDLRDRTEMSFEKAQEGSGNWQTDMCIGASMILFVLKDFPNREIWLENAYAVIYGQLITNLNADGSWPESIRYHYAVLERFASYARVLKRMTGIDWFRDTRLLDMFSYGIDIQTPAYEYFDYCISTPPFGDHKLGDGSEFAIYGLYLKEAASRDALVADKMYLAWTAAGKKRKGLWGESIAVENLLYPSDYQLHQLNRLELKSTDAYRDAGIYVFRNRLENGKEDYLALMSSPKKIGHGHLDQGSFVLFKDSVPVIMDSGIEGYFDVSTPWHISSYSHACMLFQAEKIKKAANPGFINLSAGNYTREHGYWDTPDSSRVLSVSLGEKIEALQMEISQKEHIGRHIRSFEVDMLKRIWTIQDKVEEFDGEILFSLPLVAQKIDIKNNQIHVIGYYGVELDIEVKSTFKMIQIEEGRTTPVYPSDERQQYLKYVRIYADAENGFCVSIK